MRREHSRCERQSVTSRAEEVQAKCEMNLVDLFRKMDEAACNAEGQGRVSDLEGGLLEMYRIAYKRYRSQGPKDGITRHDTPLTAILGSETMPLRFFLIMATLEVWPVAISENERLLILVQT